MTSIVKHRRFPAGGGLFAAAVCGVSLAALLLPAGAAGTARIQHPDGTAKTYTNVRISIDEGSMALTSSDGQGTIYIGKAACTAVGDLLRCSPYDATLDQHGASLHIALKGGTVWLNPTANKVQMPHSSAQLPPRGVMLTMETKAGTFVSLWGTVDELKK